MDDTLVSCSIVQANWFGEFQPSQKTPTGLKLRFLLLNFRKASGYNLLTFMQHRSSRMTPYWSALDFWKIDFKMFDEIYFCSILNLIFTTALPSKFEIDQKWIYSNSIFLNIFLKNHVQINREWYLNQNYKYVLLHRRVFLHTAVMYNFQLANLKFRNQTDTTICNSLQFFMLKYHVRSGSLCSAQWSTLVLDLPL